VRHRLSDAEQRVRKRRRRDLDDEDYEEPIQPRRVSARKASQVRLPNFQLSFAVRSTRKDLQICFQVTCLLDEWL
jgi:hypothetical protein